MHDMSEFRAVYLEELDEQLQCIEEEVLQLERSGTSAEGVSRLFRAAHTLKGSSAAMGYERIKQLTHEMEHLLDKVRNGQMKISAALTDLLLACLDGLKALQSDIQTHDRESWEITGLVQRLRDYGQAAGSVDEGVMGKANVTPVVTADSGLLETMQLNPQERELLRQSAAGSRTVYSLRLVLSESCPMKVVRACLIDVELRTEEAVIHTDFNPEQMEDDTVREFTWLLASSSTAEELASRVRQHTDVERVELEAATVPEWSAENEDEEQGKEQMYTPAPEALAAPEGYGVPAMPEKHRSQTIRVHVDRLEQLMNLVGELVIDQTGLAEADKRLKQKFGGDEAVSTMSDLADHLTRTISELQDSVMKIRMLPMEQLFNRFPRMVRDLAKTLGKQVELIIEGQETELDRTLIEEIGDPLIHLIRNAVDHGIEAPGKRSHAGKAAFGRLVISAAHEDNQVLITVADDGAGIDAAAITASAVRKGLITEEDAAVMSDKQAIALIFHPGFSMAATVSEVSGRGVGMDIVRTQIERLNGLIDIETERGKGTIFRIRIPLTLAIITGLVVRSAGRTFILPMNNVIEIIRCAPGEFHLMQGRPVLQFRNQVLPVLRLDATLGYPAPEWEMRNIPVVIIGRGDKRVALAVDELAGNQDIVIKSLGAYVGKIGGVAGATIMGNGRVALILDIGGLIKLSEWKSL